MEVIEPRDEIGTRILLTPGPLTTTKSVKEAMLKDIGSWDADLVGLVRDIRQGLLEVAGLGEDYSCTLMQGSGTFSVESVVSSVVPPTGKALIIVNGAYGERLVSMAEIHRIPHTVLRYAEDRIPVIEEIERELARDSQISHVIVVHCETTTGILNPIHEIGLLAKRYAKSTIVDAMSSFGAYEIDMTASHIDHLISSANKCIEGVPGFGFTLSRREALLSAKDGARSLSLNLYDQWQYFEKAGQFRYTPPTHVLLAFRQALSEFKAEGGVQARGRRYRENHRVLMQGMKKMGFRSFLDEEIQSCIITAYYYPESFNFQSFYDRLRRRGYIIYPGKLTYLDTFRIGTIGSIGNEQIEGLLEAIRSLQR